ncbi:MAG: hypothetical protein Q8K99_05760 [Actinomycetota bacterium]|nr:hypothetical protein [Actinomycetota bacterium]
MSLTFEIVTPRGLVMRRTGLDQVVLRRKEVQFDNGVEVTVLPRSASMLVKLPAHEMRLVEGPETTYVRVDGGFAEINNDVVSVLTTSAAEIAPLASQCASPS